MNKIIYTSPNRFLSAETAADSEPQPIVSTSCPACSNTFVAAEDNNQPCIKQYLCCAFELMNLSLIDKMNWYDGFY